ncbi:MAG: hypothetical protein U0Q16_30945 [Bryobacteraceae bacterium]
MSGALADQLRRAMPPDLLEAIVKISKQLDFEVIDPILSAPTPAESGEMFHRLLPRFFHYYMSMFELVLAHGLDTARLADLTQASYKTSEALVSEIGPGWLGEEAALSAVFGLSTMAHVSKVALTRALPAGDPETANRWVSMIFSYILVSTCLLSAIHELSKGNQTKARPEIGVELAKASEAFALEAYRLSKQLGLLEPVAIAGEIAPSEEEDIALVNAGLAEWVAGIDR